MDFEGLWHCSQNLQKTIVWFTSFFWKFLPSHFVGIVKISESCLDLFFVFFPIATVNTMTEANLRWKGFISAYPYRL